MRASSEDFFSNKERRIFSRIRTHQSASETSLNAHQSHYSGYRFFGYNSLAAAAREVFEPSTDSASLVVPSQKTIFHFWVLGSLGGSSQVGVFSHFYGLLYPALDAHRMGPHFGPNIFMKLGYLTSLLSP